MFWLNYQDFTEGHKPNYSEKNPETQNEQKNSLQDDPIDIGCPRKFRSRHFWLLEFLFANRL